jgi:hypothetical protein
LGDGVADGVAPAGLVRDHPSPHIAARVRSPYSREGSVAI